LRRDVLTTEPARRDLRPFILLGVILAVIALAGLGYWLAHRGFARTDDAEIDGNITTVSAQIAGRVRRVLVADNAHVTPGEVLVELDPRDQEAALAKARAALAQAVAQVAVARAQVAQAQASLLQDQADETKAAHDFARYHAINPGATTQQQIDAATTGIAVARARAAAAAAQRDAAVASVQAAQAGAQAAEAAVQSAQLQRGYTLITAPCAGHVALKTVEPGMYVAAGAAMMAIVGDQVWVTADYKETQLAGIRPGARATIEVDAVPGIAFAAHVDSIQYGTGTVFSLLPAQNATGNYIKIVQRVPVKLLFDDPRIADYVLAPGMSVTPSITLDR
jgi:membrane fusion protein (multidrug efflux system)